MHGIYSVQKVVHSEEARNKKKQVEEKQDEEKKEEYVKDTEMNKQKNLLSVLQYYAKKRDVGILLMNLKKMFIVQMDIS